jgi:hypothetical protein
METRMKRYTLDPNNLRQLTQEEQQRGYFCPTPQKGKNRDRETVLRGIVEG